MYLSTVVAVAATAGVATAHPFSRLFSRAVPSFPAGSTWDILLNKGDFKGDIDTISGDTIGAIDIDLFDTPKETIAKLKATMNVICYFSAGSKEDWRPDVGDFKDGDFGQGLDGWPGEFWVNVKSDNVRAIMKKRIELAAANGCSAIDPDNTDGLNNNQDGFGYDKAAYVDYIKFLASTAAVHNLAIGLKNSIELIPDVVDVIQFAVNEQCHQYSECDKYKPFTDANKAVFNIEYGGNSCDQPAGVKLSTLIKPEDQGLNTLGGACEGQGQTTPPKQDPQPSQVAPGTKPVPSSTQAPTPPKPTVSAPVASPPTAKPTGVTTTKPGKPTPTGTDKDDEGDDQDEKGDDNDDEDSEEDDDDDNNKKNTQKPRPSGGFWNRPGRKTQPITNEE